MLVVDSYVNNIKICSLLVDTRETKKFLEHALSQLDKFAKQGFYAVFIKLMDKIPLGYCQPYSNMKNYILTRDPLID